MLISKRRLIHAISYEGILLVIIAIALSFIFDMPMEVTGTLGVFMAVVSVFWNMIFNHYFEKVEHKFNWERTANSNMRCDSLKSLMIINKLSKFL
ncbi:chlorhexidine efflux transporter [Acinetobacter baumannii]|uniref:chlorhexidine efflux transporter n=1 Tax=Acinetobacter baumannii TaxID=470 RepID=UPI00387EE5F4